MSLDFEQIAGQTELLGGLSGRSIKMLAEGHRLYNVGSSEMIFLEGEVGEALFVLVSGAVRLFRSDENGREIVVHYVRPGEVFAEAVLFDDQSYPVSAQAQDASTLICIDRTHVIRLLEDPEFRSNFLANMLRKLRFLARQVSVLASCEVHERLVSFLVSRYGQRRQYEIELSKKDVAAAIFTTPETLSRTVARMETDGLIVWRNRKIEIKERLWWKMTDERGF